jgi:hypothetical protein
MIRSVVRRIRRWHRPSKWNAVEKLVEVVLTGGRADRKARYSGGSRLVICKLRDAARRPPFSCAASSLLESPGVPRTARAKRTKNGFLQFASNVRFQFLFMHL